MDAVKVLMEHYWINKSQDRELYKQVRRESGACRKFLREQLGWQLISNDQMIKIEKIPAHAESFMGITDFTEIRDYGIFCALLIFLEDKEDNEQFLLSELVTMVEAQLQDFMTVDWTMFTQRKSLVRALQFAERIGLLVVFDGASEHVSGGIEHEVLYENTGLSRYFATSFGYDISEFTSYRDFEHAQIDELETDRGHFRINRVYRQLVTAPAMFWDSAEDADSLYLKNQRQWVAKYLEEYLGGIVQIHKNAAFMVIEEGDSFGELHPREATISSVVLNICDELRGMVQKGLLVKEANDQLILSPEQWQMILSRVRTANLPAWSKEFREMAENKLGQTVLDYMQSWLLCRQEDERLIIYPSAGKITGYYPPEFLQKEIEKNG